VNLFYGFLIVVAVVTVAVVTVAVAAMLFTRRRAPEGGYLPDGDRASGALVSPISVSV
jgi:hypothetical protein